MGTARAAPGNFREPALWNQLVQNAVRPPGDRICENDATCEYRCDRADRMFGSRVRGLGGVTRVYPPPSIARQAGEVSGRLTIFHTGVLNPLRKFARA